MFLSDRDIKSFIKKGKIKIIPKPDFEEQLSPASLDLKLGKEFRVFELSTKSFIDPFEKETFKNLTRLRVLEKGERFILQPGQFVLGVTEEEIALPSDIAVRIEGRSSWGRLGLIIHSTAGYVDPGFRGRLTLEMTNINNIPIILYPGIRICQIAFELLSSPAEVIYPRKKNAKYFDDKLPTESKLYKDFDE